LKPAHIKSQRQKEIRRIYKRQRELIVKMRELGYKKLEKPIRHGWFKEIIITHQLEKYKYRRYIEEVYEKIEKQYWGRTKDEAEKKWLHQTSKYLINKDIPTISKRQYNKLSDGAKRICIPFQFYNERKKLRTRFYFKIPKGAYKIKFSRAYITHRKRIDPVLESEYKEISQKLDRKGYYELCLKDYNWKRDSWKHFVDKQRDLNKKRDLQKIKNYSIQELINDEISWERN